MGILFCLLAVGIAGLATFMIVQMSRNDDSISDGVGDRERRSDRDAEEDRGGDYGVLVSPRDAGPKRTIPEGTWRPSPFTTTRATHTRMTRTTRKQPTRATRATRTTLRTRTTRTTLRTRTTHPPSGSQLAAQWINASLNWSHNPCDDFYSFVCSRFEGGQSALAKLENLTLYGIKEELRTASIPPRGQSAAQKAAAMFQACVQLGSNANNSEVESLRYFLRALGLDMSDMHSYPNFDIADRITRLSLVYGLPALVQFHVVAYPNKPGQRFLHMLIHKEDEEWMQSSFYAFDERRLARFYEEFVSLYVPKLDAYSVATRIVRAEGIVRPFIEELRSKWNKLLIRSVGSLGSLTKYYVTPEHWRRLITSYSNHTFDAFTMVVVLDNATAVVVLLMDHSRMSRDDSRLLMAWCLFHRLLHLAHGRQLIDHALTWGEGADPVSDVCYRQVNTIMALAITKQYFDKWVPPSALASADEMARSIIRSLLRKLKTTAWIKDPVRDMALRKVENLHLTIGYPKELTNASAVEALYADFPDVRRGFLYPYLESLRVLTLRTVQGNGIESFMTTPVNAEYEGYNNSVTIYAGILQPPVFIREAPHAMNYGGYGQIFGHELMHAFDVEGITLDYQGHRVRYNNTVTMRDYEKKVLCLRASYQKAETEERARKLIGEIDSEGFADFTGLLLAHDAFSRLPYRHRTVTVPNVGLTSSQVFFVAHCIKWCHSDKGNKRRVPGGLYWHGRSRCIVPLQNMPQFAQAFYCKPGDAMNPEKCTFF
ncbi:neprilysin-2-like [Amblyomma americanum]